MSKKIVLTQQDINAAVRRMADEVGKYISTTSSTSLRTNTVRIYGVPRGGVPVAYLLAHRLLVRSWNAVVVDAPQSANIIVDDIIDSGATAARMHQANPDAAFFALYKASDCDGWLVFPWEGSMESSAEDIPVRLLQFIGEEPSRGGLVETPRRFLRAWEHYTSGYGVDPAEVLKTFEDGAEQCDELVLVKDIPVYSHCEHHLAPFFGVAHVGYIPAGRIVGLSKLSRLVDVFARRLQVQERLTNQIADALNTALQPAGVAVVLQCRHI